MRPNDYHSAILKIVALFILTTLIAVTAAAAAAAAAAAEADALSSSPAWLTELSLTTRESRDGNVYLTNMSGPAGRDLANRSFWVTSISPRPALDLALLLEGSDPDFDLKHLNPAYSPEIIRYHDQPCENHDIQRVATGLEASWGTFSIKADNKLGIVEGCRETPQYTGRSNIASGATRSGIN